MPLEDQKAELEEIARLYKIRVEQALRTLTAGEVGELVLELEQVCGQKTKTE